MTTPIYFPDAGFRFIHMSELYTGPTGTGRIVPNVDWGVIDWDEGWYRVVSVNPVTYESVLEPKNFDKTNGGVIAENSLLSTGPNSMSESFRIYINTNVTPISLAFDGRLYMHTNEVTHVKVFRGTDTSSNGHVISAVFNPSNVLISEDIPMVDRILPNGLNLGTRSPAQASSIEPLPDGSIVTAVFYNAANIPVTRYKLFVEVSDFVHSVDLGKKYVIDIELLSNFISPTNSDVLEYPVNLPLQSGGLLGRVYYNDATHDDLPIDNTRFRLFGINEYTASTQGQRSPLVLNYTLQPDEYGYGVQGVDNRRFLNKEYYITTIERHAAYDVKLFVLPKWNTSLGKWDLNFYLYNLERNQFWDATAFVTVDGNYNGTSINTVQRLTLSVNLKDVDNIYEYYLYQQIVNVTLKASGSNTTADTYWLLQYVLGVFLGYGLRAVFSPGTNPGIYKLDISQNITDPNDWLDTIYWPTKPIYHLGTESEAPTPTHVRVKIGNLFSREITIQQAVTEFIDNISIPLTTGMTASIEFFQRTITDDYELGVVNLNLK